MKNRLLLVAGILGFGTVSTFAVDAAVTIPTFGIDMAASITALVVAIGAVILVAVGAKLGYAVLRKGVTWAKSALS